MKPFLFKRGEEKTNQNKLAFQLVNMIVHPGNIIFQIVLLTSVLTNETTVILRLYNKICINTIYLNVRPEN
jgi:hypothetical protein